MIEELEETIEQVRVEVTTPVRIAPEKGTDEYYDQGLDQKNYYDGIVSRLRTLNEVTIKAFNDNANEVYSLLASMRTLLEACNRRVASLKESSFSEIIESSIEGLEEEADMLEENIDDFTAIHDRHSKNQRLQSLLSQL